MLESAPETGRMDENGNRHNVETVETMRVIESMRTAKGLYTIDEAAVYARMPVATLRYWLYGVGGHTPLRDTQIKKSEGRYLTFVEFVEALAIRTLRHTYHISLPKIREAIKEAQGTYEIEYPFATKKHRTFLLGKEIHIIFDDKHHPVQLTGKGKRQQSMRPCIESFMRDLEFDDKGVAMAYHAYHYYNPATKNEIAITMNPQFNFGFPLVGKTGYTPQTLWRAAIAEGSEKKAAEYYEVDFDSVVAAGKFCEDLKLAA